CSSDADSNVFF
nr:immunoglobulin light chain junction region [Macaca mulatta]MPO14319.1 immunoglobulin light chain junction region [Macaca mulatta]